MSATTAIQSGQGRREWALWLWWVLANALAILLGVVILYALVFLAEALVSGINEDRFFGYAFGPVLVLSLSALQWLVLRRRIPRSGRWFLATGAGLVIGYALVTVAIQSIPALTAREPDLRLLSLIVMIGFGGSLGLAQWAVLRRHLRMSGLWIVASMLGWASASLLIGKSIDRTTDIIALAVVPAAWAGLALVLLWQQPEEEAS
jgi:hypothetical protein